MEVAPKHTQKLKSYVIWQDPTKKTMVPVFLEHLAVLTKGSTLKNPKLKKCWRKIFCELLSQITSGSFVDDLKRSRDPNLQLGPL